ncbi:bacteriohopanetetrol glucosamine biosynthesis glycosyltransferase HpnI [Sphingomonas sp. CCH18-H6]|uniref:bacteriohopanetetrol glucosamine biosynthesis glycosyltransferase HpnI n=1 Tax=Sphingomonas sp. CCH18-H6 TaxID=1768787 RepID=UPI000ADB0D37|nr:bacteriohopanetetrol glucosamine biosynthesis glycosyltransferase HpnI [Sphingomonas sp. CCH18-H6]
MGLFIEILLLMLAGLGLAYTLAAAMLVRAPPPPRAGGGPVGISVLKPLHGAEPALAENLRTLFAQTCAGGLQFVFGTRDADDPALGILADVRREFPDADVALVVDPARHGANNKLSNLLNMAGRVRHPLVVVSDSDVATPPGTLDALAATLADPAVGIVSCLHLGRGDNGGWSRLAAMDISYRFMPSVILGQRAGLAHPVLGPMMALRADTLERIGGFDRFRDVLADDFELGRAVRALGLRVALTGPFVLHGCSEGSLAALVRHELRWSRTIFTIDRPGFAGSLITHVLPNALLAATAMGWSVPAAALVVAALAARYLVKWRIDRAAGFRAAPAWWLPARDLLSFAVFLATFFTRRVDWRGSRFRVTRDGRLIPTRSR